VVGAVGRNGCRRCSWEEELLLNSQFPDLSLEDKAVFLMGGGSDDRNGVGPANEEGEVLANKNDVGHKIWRVYQRRVKKGSTKCNFCAGSLLGYSH
jgi:hypothetical protein